jgi:5'-3' exonuclease
LLEEEGFHGPLIDAESAVELSQLQQYVAKLRPEMELAAEDARTSVRELRNDLCREQRQLRQQAEKLRNQSHLQEQQLRKDQQKLRMQLDPLRQEWEHWTEI